jgi:hypothetical protein
MKRLKQLCSARAGVTLVTLLLVTSGLAAAPGYHLIKTYKLGGDGGWVSDARSHLEPSLHFPFHSRHRDQS